MTEIKIDREKVIKGLECCKMPDCPDDCPYCNEGPTCRQNMERDALALLKAEEPRVLTLEEVKAAAGHDVWIEMSGNIEDDVLFTATIEGCGTNGLCTRYVSFNYSLYGIRPYGWRCWTSRPTEGQRKAVAWE